MDEIQVLIDFERDQETGSPASLGRWVRENPNHSTALLDHALSMKVTYGVLEAEPTTEERAAAGSSYLRNRDRISAAIQQAFAQTTSVQIESLLATAQAAGVNKKSLLEQVGIDLTILTKLERRLIRASTIPKALIDKLSEAIGSTREQVSAYLRLPPTLSVAADYKSAQAPTTGQQQDFAQALAAANLSPDAQAELQNMTNNPLGEEA